MPPNFCARVFPAFCGYRQLLWKKGKGDEVLFAAPPWGVCSRVHVLRHSRSVWGHNLDADVNCCCNTARRASCLVCSVGVVVVADIDHVCACRRRGRDQQGSRFAMCVLVALHVKRIGGCLMLSLVLSSTSSQGLSRTSFVLGANQGCDSNSGQGLDYCWLVRYCACPGEIGLYFDAFSVHFPFPGADVDVDGDADGSGAEDEDG